jgi:hypothetical protein
MVSARVMTGMCEIYVAIARFRWHTGGLSSLSVMTLARMTDVLCEMCV